MDDKYVIDLWGEIYFSICGTINVKLSKVYTKKLYNYVASIRNTRHYEVFNNIPMQIAEEINEYFKKE